MELIGVEQAAALIGERDSVAIMGAGGGIGEPTALLRGIGERFRVRGEPRGLALFHATGLGDRKEIGTDLLALPGLVRRDIAGHLAMAPKMGRMILEDRIESYNFPQGVLSQMFGAVAARKPGVFSKVGLHTYIDPRIEGGRMNRVTREELVRVMEIDGEEWLFFPALHFDVALVRGTEADGKGNITSEEEAAILEGLAIAQAARACGGKVIAQVKRLAGGEADPRRVRIPGICVDYVVVDPEQKQTCLGEYEPSFSGAERVALESLLPLPLDARKVIARRAAKELFPGAVVNLGVGMPDGVASVATEEGMIGELTFAIEQGIVGGMPARGVIFGVAYNPQAIIGEDAQFNFFDGGCLDLAFLGMAQADREGNVNVSKVGSMLAGCGGFINISQNARKVIFCGTFTAKGLECQIGGGRIAIRREGTIEKFVEEVEQITFSGRFWQKVEQEVLYVTERCVFSLEREGPVLKEIAPGVDLEREILGRMGFAPKVAPDLQEMDRGIFSQEE